MFHAKNLNMKALWNKICCIFGLSKLFNMEAQIKEQVKEKDYIKTTHDGRMYIETEDFLSQQKIKSTVDDLMSSSIYASIIERQKRIAEEKNKRQ